MTLDPMLWNKVTLSKQRTVELLEENGELILPLPDDILEDLGWTENTIIEWTIENGHMVLRKIHDVYPES